MLKAYFDGSGKNDLATKQLTLGGLVASHIIWTDFEKGWREVLKSHSSNVFHTTDAMALRGDFKSWTNSKVDGLIKDLLNMAASFWGRNMYVKTCTIDLDDYRKLKTRIPDLRTPEEICVNFCCGSGLPPDDANPNAEFQEVEFYFDVGEQFRKNIQRSWDRLRARKTPGWSAQVKAIDTAVASETPALQAADLVAWIAAAQHRKIERAKPYYYALHLVLTGMHPFYHYQKLMSDYPNG